MTALADDFEGDKHPVMSNGPELEILNAIYTGDLLKVEEWSKQVDLCSLRSDQDATLLHAAALSGHTAIVSFLLSFGLSVRTRSKEGSTALHYAAKGTLLPGITAWFSPEDPWLRCEPKLSDSTGASISSLLRHQGVDVPENFETLSIDSDEFRSEIVDAFLEVSRDAAALHQKLVATGISFERADPFFARFQNGYPDYLKTVDLLLANGADIEAENDRLDRPVDEAVLSPVPDIVEFLLQRGAYTGERERPGGGNSISPMQSAIDYGNFRAVRILHRHGVKIEFEEYYPLHTAAGNERTQMLSCLLELGGNIEQRNRDGDTPLICAAGGYLGTTNVLLERGADIQARNSHDRGVLHRAAPWKDTLVRFLNKGLNINSKDTTGRTPLHYAAENLAEENVTILVQQGADVNALDCHGQTPLHRVFGEDELRPDIELPTFQALISAGADRSLQDNNEETTYGLAVRYKYPQEFLDLLKPKRSEKE